MCYCFKSITDVYRLLSYLRHRGSQKYGETAQNSRLNGEKMHGATRKTREDASERAFYLFITAVGVDLRERETAVM